MAEDIFKPATPEELAKRKEDGKKLARRNIPKNMGEIKAFIVKLKHADCMEIDLLKSSIFDLEQNCGLLRDEEGIKKH